MNLTMYNALIQTWYQWAHFVALAVAAASAFWIFYDAARRGIDPVIWKALVIASVILVLPSLVLWAVPAISIGRLTVLIAPFAYIGLGAVALALLSLILYVGGVGVEPAMISCPSCGRRIHPSWDECPYCAEREAQQAAPAPPTPSPPSPQPSAPPQPAPAPSPPSSGRPTEYSEGGGPTAPPREGKTEVLRPDQPRILAWMILLSGAHQGKEFRLSDVTTIGREPGRNDIVLDDNAVSRQHAKVKLEEGQFVLYDLASTSGTFIKDQESEDWVEVHKHTLVDGDRVKIGRERLNFMRVTEEEA